MSFNQVISERNNIRTGVGLKAVLVSVVAWVVGILYYVILEGAFSQRGALLPQSIDGFVALSIYGSMGSAIPSFLVYWIFTLRIMIRLRSRLQKVKRFVYFPLINVLFCVAASVLLTLLSPHSSGPLSRGSIFFHTMFAVVGLCLGFGYALVSQDEPYQKPGAKD